MNFYAQFVGLVSKTFSELCLIVIPSFNTLLDQLKRDSGKSNLILKMCVKTRLILRHGSIFCILPKICLYSNDIISTPVQLRPLPQTAATWRTWAAATRWPPSPRLSSPPLAASIRRRPASCPRMSMWLTSRRQRVSGDGGVGTPHRRRRGWRLTLYLVQVSFWPEYDQRMITILFSPRRRWFE